MSRLRASDGSRVLQIGDLAPLLEQELRGRYDAVALHGQASPATFLSEHGAAVRVAVTSGRAGVSADLMAALPNLGAIVNYGVGYDKTDVAAARARGIQLSYTPDVLTDCVADLAVGALIGISRNLVVADRFVRDGEWPKAAFPLATKVSGKRVGILGLGKIGRAIARRLSAFDMQISYHSRRVVPDCGYAFVESPRQLALGSDFLVVAAAGGPASSGLVSSEVLDALGPSGYLVNVSRGAVIDETALIAALSSGSIAGAALDVFLREPQVPQELRELGNVLLLPHVGSATRETRAAMADLVLRNIEAFFADGRVITPI